MNKMLYVDRRKLWKPARTTCALCQNSTDLKRSHIVSDLVWKRSGLLDGKNQFYLQCFADPTLNDTWKTGLKERLLCAKCETRRNVVETITARTIFDTVQKEPNQSSDLTLSKLDYKSIRLFMLFQIWCMGVSKHPFYSRVVLGRHERKLRNMLLNDDPGEPWQYGTILTRVLIDGKYERALFTQPQQNKYLKGFVVSFVIAGLQIEQFVSIQRFSRIEEQLFIKKGGTWITGCRDHRDIPLLKQEIETHLTARAKGQVRFPD